MSDCQNSTVSFFLAISYNFTRFSLLIPLCIFILYLAFQQWRCRRSFTSMSHSDIFTYHLAAVELLWALAIILYFCGLFLGLSAMVLMGGYLSYINFYGEFFFHILTCVERYLAVVHPVTYLGLRNARGVRIRNISVGCTWAVCFISSCVISQNPLYPVVSDFVLTVVSLVIISFCSFCVLCVLIRPGPGEGGGNRKHINQSKQRAFFTILTIMGVVWLWFVGSLIPKTLHVSGLLSPSVQCLVDTSRYWCYLPSSLVLPLLYLHRAGKLSGCSSNRGSR